MKARTTGTLLLTTATKIITFSSFLLLDSTIPLGLVRDQVPSLLGFSSKRSVFCKTNYSGRNYRCCEKIFRKKHCENVLHCVAVNVLKRACLSVCSKMEATSNTFYKMYFLLLTIKILSSLTFCCIIFLFFLSFH